jgi:hypothetical protein
VGADDVVRDGDAWTGDAQLTAGAASLLFDIERLYQKMFQDMVDAQTAEGEVPLLSPINRNYGYAGTPAFKPVDCCGATPAWDTFWLVVPWESYMRHGDRRTLQRVWPLMRKYLDEWVPRWTGKDNDSYAYTLTAGLGDWLPPEGVPTINALVSSAFYARMARIAADTARALGDRAEEQRYSQLFERVRGDFNARFLGADGIYREKADERFVQTAEVLPLAFDLVPSRPPPGPGRSARARRQGSTRRARLRGRHRRGVRAARAVGHRTSRRSGHGRHQDRRAELGATGPTRSASRHAARAGRPTRDRATTTFLAPSCSGSTRASPAFVRSSPGTR